MKIGFIGLGRMGGNMVDRLLQGGHEVVGYARSESSRAEARAKGAVTVDTLEDVVKALAVPRVIWVMVPSGDPTEETIMNLKDQLAPGDLIVDGGNSNYRDSMRRADALAEQEIRFLDIGTSGGIWGLKVGYCMMVGGEKSDVLRVEPALKTLAPREGFLHVGPHGAGHFVKMVHNGIEYGLLQAYAEGFELLESKKEFALDLSAISHLWNQGSVVRSWLLELAELAFQKDTHLEKIQGYVEDSGEGRWTVEEALAQDVPAMVITAALYARFRSRQTDSFSNKVIAALRNEFGGHAVKTTGTG